MRLDRANTDGEIPEERMWFCWCSGYHICLTRRRSQVRHLHRTVTFFFFFLENRACLDSPARRLHRPIIEMDRRRPILFLRPTRSWLENIRKCLVSRISPTVDEWVTARDTFSSSSRQRSSGELGGDLVD